MDGNREIYEKESNEGFMSKGEKVFFWIASGVGVLMSLFVIANVCIAYYAQYNIKGVSSVISVYIDEERPREYLGKLDGYNIYTEQMRGEEMIVIDFLDNHIPLTEAMEKGLVSVRDWRRKAWDTEKDGDAEIYRYESYEIIIAYDDCIIRPLTSWDHLPYDRNE